ncbi:Exostosin, GT47 domain [Dillenia turbinata]|uniref:Exostosin, GT47 domain n=1 Tax=Dillenia turbinata TaxID=194707 RepID=A0AAN8Z8Q5_9MAGN
MEAGKNPIGWHKFSAFLGVNNLFTSIINYTKPVTFDDSLPNFPNPNEPIAVSPAFEDLSTDISAQRTREFLDPCLGKYIYIHNLPSQFNDYFVKNCEILCCPKKKICESLSNLGLGPQIQNTEDVFTNSSWYLTNQFMLEVIFHQKMKRYECLTTNSSLASAIYVPFYAGLDIARYLWDFNISIRDWNSMDLVKWLSEQPEWKSMMGLDHFLAVGRISWDFRRKTDVDSDWGTKLMFLPESRNMTFLAIESSPSSKNNIAIPYPTYFHPSSDNEILEWQNKVRAHKREYLFSFAGAPRPDLNGSIRGDIIEQCRSSSSNCKLLECDLSTTSNCQNPSFVMKLLQSSHFCLQPIGDSYTRRSTFDSILAGCIPVFFHLGSSYVEYLWHLPSNYSKYSVFIPEEYVKSKKVSIEKILLSIPKERVEAMREEILRLIPSVIYSNPMSRLETLEDAFDIAVKGVLNRIETLRSEIREGSYSGDTSQDKAWKEYLLGPLDYHEWDGFLSGTDGSL